MERIPAQCSSDVAGIAIRMPDQPTSGDLLAALHKAWKAGWSDGFGQGVVKGQKAICDLHNLVYEAVK